MASINYVQSFFAYIVFTLTVTVNVISLYLLWKRRDKTPIKSRAPLWLGIGQLQTGTNLWSMVEMAECHFVRVSVFLAYSGYIVTLIVRCWKLHFVFNINKSKLLKTDYKSWFQRRKFYVSERFLVPTFFGFCIIVCFLGGIFHEADPSKTWHAQFGGDCRIPWVPDMITNAIIFAMCVLTLIVFSFKLHNVDDGFSISKELRLSIALILGAWGIYFAVIYAARNTFNNEGGVSPDWFLILAQIGSTVAAVYWPLYLSYTDKWADNQAPMPVRVSINELKDMYYFLNTAAGVEPFLRFLHSEFSAELLFLWRDIDEFSKELDPMERKIKAKTIVEEYLDPEGNKYLPESETFLENLKFPTEGSEIPLTIFNDVKLEVEKRLRNKFGRFLLSPVYKQYVTGITIKESLMELGWQN